MDKQKTADRADRRKKKLVKAETGKEATAIELTVEDLEERLSPSVKGGW